MPTFVLPFMTAIAVAGVVWLWFRVRSLVERLSATEATLESANRRLTDERTRLAGRTAEQVLEGMSSQGRGLSTVQGDLGRLEVIVDGLEKRVDVVERVAREATDTAIAAQEVATGVPAAVVPAEEVLRRHLASIGVSELLVDVREERPDRTVCFIVRGLRGHALWHGKVIIQGQTVCEATPLPSRQFP